jgi:Annexin
MVLNLVLLSMIDTRADTILRVFFDNFEKRFPALKIEKLLENEGSKSIRLLKPFIRCIRDPQGFRASLFEMSMAGMGADEASMNYLMARYRDPSYIGPIADSFMTLYGKSLEGTIRKEFSGDHEKLLVAIVEYGKLAWGMIKVQEETAKKHQDEVLALQMVANQQISAQQQQANQQMQAQQMAAQQLAAQQLAAQQLAAQQMAAQQAQQFAAQQMAAQQAQQQFAAQQLAAQQYAAQQAAMVRDHIMSDNVLYENQQIAVPGGAFFVVQGDGNTVLYARPGGPAIWATGTGGRGPGPYRFAVQGK